MKKALAILLCILSIFLTACGSEPAQDLQVQETAAAVMEAADESAVYTEAVEVPPAPPTEAPMATPAEETIDYSGFYEESMDDVRYKVLESWRRTDYSNESLKQCMYYLDESNDNCIMTMLLYADNQIYTREQAEEYMDIFMEGFFSSQNGYSGGSFSPHTANVPARHGYYLSGESKIEVEAYCYLPSTTSIFILSKWHLIDSTSEIDEETFLKVVNSVQLPELNVKDAYTSSSKKSQSSDFTNQYGTASTQCAYSGCTRKIAPSGDTNCCTQHSNKCGNCGCYIDSDAIYCMSCLTNSLGGSSDDYDYDKGYGYTAPKKGQSFSDYVKEQDPELYESITDNYHSATGKNSSSGSKDYDYDKGYGYTAPKKGQSFSDYVKEQDPELYESITDNYHSATGKNSSSGSKDYDYDKGYGYTAPKKGQSFSDYVKEQDPELYNSLFK